MSATPTASAGPRLLGPADVRSLAAAYDVWPTKQRGQNFVIDANTVRRVVRVAGLRAEDIVLEVGPGLGSLTLALLEHVAHVTAVEVDTVLAGALPQTLSSFAPDHAGRVAVVEADALQVTSLPGQPPTALVANLPYNISVPVLFHLLATFPSIERVLVMVQLEVADRLAASPGSKVYGIPSVKAAWYADVRRVGLVGRNVFWPAPRVDSGLVAMTRHEPVTSVAGRDRVFAVVDAAFAQRRKTLRAALTCYAGSAAVAEQAIRAAGIDPSTRGERLSVADFARLADAFEIAD